MSAGDSEEVSEMIDQRSAFCRSAEEKQLQRPMLETYSNHPASEVGKSQRVEGVWGGRAIRSLSPFSSNKAFSKTTSVNGRNIRYQFVLSLLGDIHPRTSRGGGDPLPVVAGTLQPGRTSRRS